MNQLVEKILSEMKNKNQVEFFTDLSYLECEQVKYKLFDDFRIEINRECKKLLISVWKK